ncbi:MAG: FAD-dependent oxidoreductase [Opitutaceae bacterium]|nr:FAD-dependent oxidoreductase [Verrucomicrobiales bacterium]
MPSLAIIGTGIAGLGCAHFLARHFDVTLYEQNNYPGGHTNTVTLDEAGKEINVDTGFMVFNKVTYPNLTRLFKELKVATKPTSMSFSVQHTPTGLEYSGSSFLHLFAQPKNFFSGRHWKMILQINRFNREAVESLDDPKVAGQTLGQYVRQRGYGEDFYNLYLVPMSSAVWSTPPESMNEFPAITLLRFFHNHGFLGLHTQHPWLTVEGGAKNYVTKILAPLKDRVKLHHRVVRVQRLGDGVKVSTSDAKTQTFDQVILACHADQALKMIVDPEDIEVKLLREFKYQTNTALLHTDESVMPKSRRAWASWNYRIDRDAAGKIQPTTIYWMNRLQGVSERQNYFVSLNGEDRVAPGKLIKRMQYEHPLFNLDALRAQADLPKLNCHSTHQRLYFCGSYFKYGFHEDAFTSALDVSRVILRQENLWR